MTWKGTCMGAHCVLLRTTLRDRCQAGRSGHPLPRLGPLLAMTTLVNDSLQFGYAGCVTSTETARDAIERTFSEDYGRLYASLVRQFRDFDLVEDALQEAMATAMTD